MSSLELAFVAFAFITLIFKFLTGKPTKPSTNQTAVRELPPGPFAWPIIGSSVQMLLNKPRFRWIHRVISDLNTEIACFRFGGVHVVVVSHNAIAREALRLKDADFATRPDSFAANTFCGDYNACVFPVPYGEHWKKMKKLLVTELNSTKTLNRLHEKRAEEADNLLAHVTKLYNQSKTVDARLIARHYCHSLTLKLAFGKRYLTDPVKANEGPGPAEMEHIKAIFTCLEYIYAFCVSDYFPFLRGFDLDGHEKIFKEGNETLERLEEPIVDERIELWRKMGGKKEVDDWLDMLINFKEDDGSFLLTPQQIKNEIKELMLALIDNPSNNVEWVLAEMLNQPETLAKAVEELDNVVGKQRLVGESDIPKLNYIKACCREGYRMHPVTPFLVPHVARYDTTLAGYFIPKGTHVLISRIALGRNRKIWEEPDRFKPERHLGDGSTDVVLTEPDMRFVSFSTGRRGCPGIKLGSTMNVMLIARLLQGFTWTAAEGRVDLRESAQNLFMAKPLVACVEPRLAPHLYP